MDYDTNLRNSFLKYEEARKTGKYNMIMDSSKVMYEYGINFHDYFYIIHNYVNLSKRYLL
jgi:hypothetical protein